MNMLFLWIIPVLSKKSVKNEHFSSFTFTYSTNVIDSKSRNADTGKSTLCVLTCCVIYISTWTSSQTLILICQKRIKY